MAGAKLPKKMLATKHLMITEGQHKTIHLLVSKKTGMDARVSVVINKMIELYITASNELLYSLDEAGEYKIVEV